VDLVDNTKQKKWNFMAIKCKSILALKKKLKLNKVRIGKEEEEIRAQRHLTGLYTLRRWSGLASVRLGRFTPTAHSGTFLRLREMLRISLIATAKTAYTA
jgi:hypothetical protein